MKSRPKATPCDPDYAILLGVGTRSPRVNTSCRRAQPEAGQSRELTRLRFYLFVAEQ